SGNAGRARLREVAGLVVGVDRIEVRVQEGVFDEHSFFHAVLEDVETSVDPVIFRAGADARAVENEHPCRGRAAAPRIAAAAARRTSGALSSAARGATAARTT